MSSAGSSGVDAGPRNIDASSVLDGAVAAFQSWAAELEPALGGLLGAALARWKGERGEAAWAAHFLGSNGTPLFEVLWAVGDALGDIDSSTWAAVGEAQLAIYFAARFQDDRVDEGRDRRLAYLEQVLDARALHLLGRVARRPAEVLDLWSSLSREFTEASLADIALRTRAAGEPWDAAALELQGRKWKTMAAPPAALLLRAGRDDLISPLLRAHDQLCVGLQIANDIAGAARDLAEGLGSPYLSLLGLSPGSSDLALQGAIRRAEFDGYHHPLFERADESWRAAAAEFRSVVGERLEGLVQGRVTSLSRHRVRAAMHAALTSPQLTLDVELTRRCNLRCPSCFVFAQEEDDADESLAELSTPLLLEILDELSRYRASLHLIGGEPFLHRGIWEVLERAARLRMDSVSINTNGLRLGPVVVGRLASLGIPVSLMVSLDGPPGVQETARGKGTTAAAVNAVRRAREAGLGVSVATILSAELVDFGIADWLEFLESEIGARVPLVLWPIYLRPGVELSAAEGGHALTLDHHHRLAAEVASLLLREVDVTIADYPVINPLLARLGVPGDRLWQCRAGDTRLSVQADGTITPCHPMRQSYGRLEPGRVAGFLERTLGDANFRRHGRRDHERCGTCAEKSICGHCQARVQLDGGAPFSHDGFCDKLLSVGETIARGPGSPEEATRNRRLRLPVVSAVGTSG